MISLSNTNRQTAIKIAERIRKCVENREFRIGDHSLHITCSFGVYTVCSGDESLSVDEIIELVDRRLYQAKNTGRNQVV